MWIADGWKDYEVLDTSGGEKLERWGDYLLVRPDPQVIWNTKKENPGWKKKNGHYHRSSKGGGEWEFFHLPEQWEINYKDLTFRLKPFSFKHTGLFPEQATNWDWFGDLIRRANRPIKVLNLFAYTGGATLAAAAAGASHALRLPAGAPGCAFSQTGIPARTPRTPPPAPRGTKSPRRKRSPDDPAGAGKRACRAFPSADAGCAPTAQAPAGRSACRDRPRVPVAGAAGNNIVGAAAWFTALLSSDLPAG